MSTQNQVKKPAKRVGLNERQIKEFYERIAEIRAAKVADTMNGMSPFSRRWRRVV